MFWLPSAIGFEKGVGEHDEFAHDRGQGDFSGFSGVDELEVFGFQVGIEASGDERWHGERLTQAGAPASNEGAPSPAAGLACDWRKPDEACGLTRFERAEFGHFDQQGKGGDVGYARNAGQDGEAIGEARVGFDDPEDCRFDGRDLTIDLLEALSVLTLQQRERQDFSAVPGGGAILHQGFASDVDLLQFEQNLAWSRARLQFQQGAHASQNRRIQAIGLRQLARRLGKAARLARIDLDERNAGRAKRASMRDRGPPVGSNTTRFAGVCASHWMSAL